MITIRPAKTREEFDEACRLVEKVYVNHGYCEFLREDEFASAVLIAVDEGRIVGTVGLWPAENGKLPVEHYFGFDCEEVCPFKRTEMMEICKMASIESENGLISTALIVSICEYSWNDESLEIAFASSKPDLIHLLEKRLSIPVHCVEKDVDENNVKGVFGQYFLDDPRPLPIYFIVKEADQYLPRLHRMLKNSVSFELDGFDHRKPVAF